SAVYIPPDPRAKPPHDPQQRLRELTHGQSQLRHMYSGDKRLILIGSPAVKLWHRLRDFAPH
uniref:Uncharacterized protein n=1 Tax=Gadus morhua TaxID=8049 RepID=A0A8C5BVB1_GADMO